MAFAPEKLFQPTATQFRCSLFITETICKRHTWHSIMSAHTNQKAEATKKAREEEQEAARGCPDQIGIVLTENADGSITIGPRMGEALPPIAMDCSGIEPREEYEKRRAH